MNVSFRGIPERKLNRKFKIKIITRINQIILKKYEDNTNYIILTTLLLKTKHDATISVLRRTYLFLSLHRTMVVK